MLVCILGSVTLYHIPDMSLVVLTVTYTFILSATCQGEEKIQKEELEGRNLVVTKSGGTVKLLVYRKKLIQISI